MWKLILKTNLYILLFVGFVYSCDEIKVPTVTGITISKLDSFSDGKYHGQGIVKIKNPSSIKISSKNVVFDLSYKDRIVTKGQSQENFTLEGKQETDVPIRFMVLIDSLILDASEILSKDSVEFNSLVKGNFTAFNFRIEHSEKVKISTKTIINGLVSQMSKDGFKISNPKIKKITLENTSFNIDLLLKNSFPFDLVINNASFNVYANKDAKNKIGDWAIDQKVMIKQKKDTVLKSDVLVNNSQATSGIFEKLMNRKLDFYIQGYVNLDYNGNLIKIPLQQHLIFNPLSGEFSTIEDEL